MPLLFEFKRPTHSVLAITAPETVGEDIVSTDLAKTRKKWLCRYRA